jgi:hypothetical protein
LVGAATVSCSGSSGGGADRYPALVAAPADAPARSSVDILIDRLAGFDAVTNNALQYAIADCMAQAGFKYLPRLAKAGAEVPSVNEPEYRRDHGYGVAPNVENVGGNATNDPNAAIRAGLSADALARYDRAILGDPAASSTIVDKSGIVTGYYNANGCVAQGYDKVYGVSQGVVQGNIDYLESLRNDAVQKMQNDPRFIALWQAWADCMHGSGYDFTTRDDAVASVAGFADAPSLAVYQNQVVNADNVCSLQHNTDALRKDLRYSYDAELSDDVAIVLSEIQTMDS